MTGEQLDREMAYAHQHHTTYRCCALYAPEVKCMRARGHDGDHASGYGSRRVMWGAS